MQPFSLLLGPDRTQNKAIYRRSRKHPISSLSSQSRHIQKTTLIELLTICRFFDLIKPMGNKQIIKITIYSILAFCAAACASKKPVPETVSSADSSPYATAYPWALNTATTAYKEQISKAKEADNAFSGYVAEVPGADPAVLKSVYIEADRTGRGQAFAEKNAEVVAVKAFFDREKDDITRRVNGGVISAKEKAECNCSFDTYGAVSYALKDSVDKRLEKYLQEAGETALLIERNEKALGKKNTDKITSQADTIVLTAHIVFVSLPTLYENISRMLSEAKNVKKTLDRTIEDEKTRESDPALSKPEKKDTKKRIQELEEARNAIDIYIAEAESLVVKAETEIPDMRSEYEKAFKALIDSVKQ